MELHAAIFDVDGVLVASPHERAWREALDGYADPSHFTTEFYQAHVAGKPRLDGARAALEGLGVPDAATSVDAYAKKKQVIIDRLIEDGDFDAFPDAVRFANALSAAGVKLALASSSKNAAAMLRRLKPDPALFLLTADAVHMRPAECVVVEDAPAGVRAANAGGMASLGIARLHDEALLEAAGAGLVVTSLDDVDIPALTHGELRSKNMTEGLPHA
jgi:beta-phosphoglucomutase